MKTPTNLNKKQEALLKDFAKIERNKIPNKLKNILKSGLDKVSN
jgi:molecular chaperone DnaJ